MSEQTYSCRLPYFFQRRHICSYCGAIYEYPISGEAAGTSQKSEAEARAEAEKRLEYIRERTALDKPCPNCGRYSSAALACLSVGADDDAGAAPCLGGLAAIFASTLLLTRDVGFLTVLLALATCGAIAFLAVESLKRLKRLNASPGENLAALADRVELRSELFDIQTKFAWGREVDKSTFQILEYWRLARLVFPAFAVLYFFGRATGALRYAQGWESASVWALWLAMIGTAIALAVLEGRAGSPENRFQGKMPLALDDSEEADAAGGESFERKGGDGETFDEPAAVGATSWNEARDDADWEDAAAEAELGGASAENGVLAARSELSDDREEAAEAELGGASAENADFAARSELSDDREEAAEAELGGASAENADFAARSELSDDREEAIALAFAAWGGRNEPSGTKEVAAKQVQTPTAPPTNRVAPVADEETPDEAEVAERERAERERVERERVERERVERERVERERVERERVERERSAALAEVERARKAEERKEGKRLGKYDASTKRLNKYDR